MGCGENGTPYTPVLCLVAQSCPTLCNPINCSLQNSSVHRDSSGKNTGVSCHALLQGIFPTQGSNPGLPHYRRILYPPSKLQIYTRELRTCVHTKTCTQNVHSSIVQKMKINQMPISWWLDKLTVVYQCSRLFFSPEKVTWYSGSTDHMWTVKRLYLVETRHITSACCMIPFR